MKIAGIKATRISEGTQKELRSQAYLMTKYREISAHRVRKKRGVLPEGETKTHWLWVLFTPEGLESYQGENMEEK